MKVCGDTSRLGVSAADVFAQFNASLESCARILVQRGLRLKRDEVVLSEKTDVSTSDATGSLFRWAAVDGQNFYSSDGYTYGDVTQGIAFFLASYCIFSSHCFFFFPFSLVKHGKKQQRVFRSSLLGESKAYQFLF